MKLVVVLFTFDPEMEILPSKYIPKVCRKINDKSMIYLAVELVQKLSPETILILCNKYNIQAINKELKSFKNQKNITFIISHEKQKFSLSNICNKFMKIGNEKSGILVLPAYSPLISLKSLKVMCGFNDYCKVKNNLFFIPLPSSSFSNSYLYLDKIKSLKENLVLSEEEMLEVNSQEEYDKAKELYGKRINTFS